MSIPSINELMGPILEILSDSELHGRDEIIDKIAVRFGLKQSDIEQTIGATSNTKLGNQIDWVRAYFTQHRIIETPEKSQFRITTMGLKVFHNHLSELSISFLDNHFRTESDAEDNKR